MYRAFPSHTSLPPLAPLLDRSIIQISTSMAIYALTCWGKTGNLFWTSILSLSDSCSYSLSPTPTTRWIKVLALNFQIRDAFTDSSTCPLEAAQSLRSDKTKFMREVSRSLSGGSVGGQYYDDVRATSTSKMRRWPVVLVTSSTRWVI